MIENDCFGFIGFDTISKPNKYTEIDMQLLQVFAEMLSSIKLRNKQQQELIEAKDRALESDRLKSSFLANMSHELRTPLNGILGFSELMISMAKDQEFQEMASMINTSGKRLHRTLDMILDISRIEANKQVIKKQCFDLFEQLRQAVKLYYPLVQAKGLAINITKNEPYFPVCTDLDILDRIVDELIYNAIKCTEKGSITISTERLNKDNVPYFAIHVTDTGSGIPPEKINILFDAFRQVSEGLDRSHEGSGLGLALCRKYAELLGGWIGVASQFGQGSTFTLTIPEMQEDSIVVLEADSHSHISKIPEQLAAAKILLVDDDVIGNKMIRSMLKKQVQLDISRNGIDGMARLQSNDYDLLLLDINLQDSYSGLDMIKDIRKDPKLCNLPVVAITAYAMIGDRERFLDSGFTDYLSKPLSQSLLIQKITTQLASRMAE